MDKQVVPSKVTLEWSAGDPLPKLVVQDAEGFCYCVKLEPLTE